MSDPLIMRNEITIAALPERIYALAAATERWPQILPHYRYVRILESRGARRVVEMGALRGRIPVSWRAEQVNDPLRPHIGFRHVAGWTKGMSVQWLFEPAPGGTRVIIEHELDFRFPVAARFIGRYVIGGFFIHSIANATLARIKALAEAGAGG